MSEASRSAVVLLGAPHSGVEVLARALENAGVVRVDGDESAPLPRLFARITKALGADPSNPGPLLIPGMNLAESRAEITRRTLETYKEKAVRATRTLPPSTLFADPQIALILPFLRRILEMARIEARFVHVHRNPLALAELSRQTSRQTPRRTWFLWHYLALEALDAAPDLFVVRAAEIGDDPDAVAHAITGDLPGDRKRWPEKTPSLRLNPRDDALLDDAPSLSAQGRALNRLLIAWQNIDHHERGAAVADLRTRFDEAMLAAGLGRSTKLPEPHAPTISLSEAQGKPEQALRPLIIHYHLFKNAGSSVDAMLKANFGQRWTDHEFQPVGRQRNLRALAELLEEHSHLDAFSSHTILLPPPRVSGRSIVPILFVRHPVVRLRSAYAFERRQTASTTGAKLAKEHDFAGYVAALLSEPRNRQAQNFQTFRFSYGTPGTLADEFDRAMTTLTELPFVGLVEEYDRSIGRLTELLKPLFPRFAPLIVRRNAENSGDTRTTDEKLAQIRAELGDALFGRLIEANRDDIALFERVAASYAAGAE